MVGRSRLGGALGQPHLADWLVLQPQALPPLVLRQPRLPG
jgi:hypothetical protein